MTHSTRSPHLELTPAEVLQLWKERHYTPKGYLYHLVLAHRKVGWWFRISNVSEFCRKWEIQRRTFYRAKATLIESGHLEESITGTVDIRVSISTCDSRDTPVSDESSAVTNGSQDVSPGSHSSSEALAPQGLCDSTDLSQIYSRSFSDHPSTQQERESKFEINPEFREWLDRRASRLPTPPTLREQWIRKQSQVEANQEEFLEWKRQIEHRETVPPPSPPEQKIEEPTLEQRLARYQQHWAVPVMRPGIEKVIATNPDWGFEIGPDGPRKAAETEPNDLLPDCRHGRGAGPPRLVSSDVIRTFVSVVCEKRAIAANRRPTA